MREQNLDRMIEGLQEAVVEHRESKKGFLAKVTSIVVNPLKSINSALSSPTTEPIDSYNWDTKLEVYSQVRDHGYR